MTWLPIKGLNGMGLDVIHLVFIAFASAGLVLSPFLFVQRRSWSGKIKFLLLIAVFGGFANLSFQTAIYHGNVVRVMILFYLLPVWSVLGGWYFLKEKPDWIRIGAVMISLAGAFLILRDHHRAREIIVRSAPQYKLRHIDRIVEQTGCGNVQATPIILDLAQPDPQGPDACWAAFAEVRATRKTHKIAPGDRV